MKDRRLYAQLTLDYADSHKIAPLSDAAFRAHVRMILWSRRFLTDGVIPDRMARTFAKPKVLQELCENDEKNPSLEKTVEGYVIHDFEEHQITKSEIEARSAVNTANGKRGGRPKANPTGTEPKPNRLANAKPTETQSTEYREQVTTDVVTNSADASMFDDFWSVWPRSEGKVAAVKAWSKVTKGTADAVILAAATAYASSPYRPEKQFVPHASTWLNGERWNDPPLEPPEQRGPTSQGPRTLSNEEQNLANFLARQEANREQGRHRTAVDSGQHG